MAALGIVAYKRNKTSEDYFVAGKSLGTFSLAAMWLASWIGGSSIIGTSTNAYNLGISGGWYVFILAFGCVIFGMYLLPYIKYIFYDAVEEVTGFTNTQIGFCLSVYIIASIICTLPSGWLADKYPPKKLLVLSGIGHTILSFLALLFIRNYAMTLVLFFGMAEKNGLVYCGYTIDAVRGGKGLEYSGLVTSQLKAGENYVRILCGDAATKNIRALVGWLGGNNCSVLPENEIHHG